MHMPETTEMTKEELVNSINNGIDLYSSELIRQSDNLEKALKTAKASNDEAARWQQSIKRIKEHIDRMNREKAKLIIPQWNPTKRCIVGSISSIGKTMEINSTNGFFETSSLEIAHAGVTRETEEEAIECAALIRRYARLLAYQNEFAKGYSFSLNYENFHIIYDHQKGCYDSKSTGRYNGLETVYFPESVAKELVRKINDGEYEL